MRKSNKQLANELARKEGIFDYVRYVKKWKGMPMYVAEINDDGSSIIPIIGMPQYIIIDPDHTARWLLADEINEILWIKTVPKGFTEKL